MDENLICLIATDAESEQFWLATRAQPAVSTVIAAAQWSDGGRLKSELLQEAILRQMDAGRAGRGLTLAVALRTDLAGAESSLRAVDAAFSRIHQLSVALRIFLLIPESTGSFGRCIPLLAQLDGEPNLILRSRREFCWVWFREADNAGARVRFDPGGVAAATAPLFQVMAGAADPTASYVVAATVPTRFSSWQSLIFGRPAWNHYFSQRGIRDLTDFLDAPTDEGVSSRAEAQAISGDLIRHCFQPVPPLPEKEDIPLPADWTEPPQAAFLCDWLSRRREQLEGFRQLSKRQHAPLFAELRSTHQAALAKECEAAPDPLEGLVRAVAFHLSVAGYQRDRSRQYAEFARQVLPAWLNAGDALLQLAAAFHPEINLGRLAEGDRVVSGELLLAVCARVKAQVVAFLDRDESGLLRCIDRLVGDTLAKMVHPTFSEVLDEELWDDVGDALMGAARAIESLVPATIQKLHEELRRIETQPPTGFFRRIGYALFTKPAEKRAQQSALRQAGPKVTELRERTLRFGQVAESCLRAAIHWDIVQDRLLAEREALGEVAAPVVHLFQKFLTRRKGAIAAIAAVQQDPLEDAVTLGLLGKTEMEELYGLTSKIASSKLLVIVAENPPGLNGVVGEWWWQDQRFWNAMDAYIADAIQAQNLNLGILALDYFPKVTDARLKWLTERASKQLIPLNNRNLRERRVVMEWRYLRDYLQRLQRDFEEAQFFDENLSVNRAEVCLVASSDQDSMDLYLHLIGFRFQDYRLWNLFAQDDIALASDVPPSV
jgi:hypothetical protein